MAHYINKDALVTEIERRRESNAKEKFFGRLVEDNYFLDFIDSLEVKEVKEADFNKEISQFIDANFEKATTGYKLSLRRTAKHFFELGLKAQYDNWKVVDSINPPKADRNKIYCVFTKQKYILAKVINHPQDDDLLQWKCTEFPFHRYDMCEGDKYMQII